MRYAGLITSVWPASGNAHVAVLVGSGARGVTSLGPEATAQRPIFWLREAQDPEHLHSILCRLEPWYEQDTGRLEILNRIRFWRCLLGDPDFDADYWLSRIENRPGAGSD